MLTFAKTEQLVADIRNAMLSEVRRHAPKLNESEQRDVSEKLTASAMELVDSAIDAIACEDFPHIDVELDNLDAKGKVTLKVKNIGEAGPQLITLRGAHLALVLTNPARFDQRRPAPRIDADEPGLPLGSAAPAEEDDEDPDEDEDDADPALGADIEGVSYYVSAPAEGERAGQFGLVSPTRHVLCWHAHGDVVQPMAYALNRHERTHGPIVGHGQAVEIARAAIPEGYSVVFEPEPSADANSEPVSSAVSASGPKRGRPSKADMQAATEAGRAAFREGLPIDTPLPDYGNTLTQCWAAGWREAEATKSDAAVPDEQVQAVPGLPAEAAAE